jgi:hypothetical protein
MPTARAADITWSLSDFNTGNLDLSGTVVQAVNFSASSQTVTIGGNTVTFVSSNLIAPVNGGFQNGPNENAALAPTYTNVVGNQPLINMLMSHSWTADIDIQPITVTGLFVGQQYQLQAFMHDARTTSCTGITGGCGAASYNLSDESGNSSAVVVRNSGSILIGNFTADAATQTFLVVGGQPTETPPRWDPSLSGYIVRAVTGGVVSATLDREFGVLSVTNGSLAPLDMLGYTISSTVGALNYANWESVADNYDRNAQPTPGNGTIDSDDSWQVLTASTNRSELSEAELSIPVGDGGVLPAGQTLNLGNFWIQNPIEDVTLQILRTDGSIFSVPVTFSGTGNFSAPFLVGDLNFNGEVDPADWPIYLSHALTSFPSTLSRAERYQRGDFNNDGANNLTDMDMFIDSYDLNNGSGAFARMIAGIPEPSSCVLLIIGCALIAGRRLSGRSGTRGAAAILAVPTLLWAFSPPAHALDLFTIQTAGHDADLILENDGSPGQNEEIGSRWFFEQGLFGNLANEQGLPASGTISGFVSPITGNNITYQFNDYNGNNALDFDGATTVGPKTLTLVTPAAYGQLAIIHSGGSMAATETATVSYTINYAGGGTQSGSFTSFDWNTTVNLPANNAARLIVNNDRANISGGIPVFDDSGTATRWAVYVTEITPNSSANIESISFTATVPNAGSGDDVDIFGLAGPSPGALNLDLEVNTTTGRMLIKNPTSNPISITGYQITSPLNGLNLGGWTSLSDQNIDPADGPDPESTAGDGVGETWDEAAGSSNSAFLEGRLFGSTTIMPGGTPLDLGLSYDTAIGDEMLVFSVRNSAGITSNPTISYVEGLDGDFNLDGIVDIADFVMWAKTGNPPGDYAVWATNYGMGNAGSGGASSNLPAVPEPHTAILLLVGLVGLLCLKSRTRITFACFRCPAPAAILVALASATLTPSVFSDALVDRDYRFGDDSLEGAVGGNAVITTFDSQGPSGALIDLAANNGPSYIDVTTTGPDLAVTRPGAATTTLGILFDGANDYLRGERLNFPQTSSGTVGAVSPAIPGPLNYSNLSDRGYQLWVYPKSAGSGTLQSVVSDLNQHDLRITAGATPTWEMRYNNTTINSNRAVAFDQWSHLMVVRPYGPAAPNGGSILYLNGEAIAAIAGAYAIVPGAGTPNQFLVVGSNPADAGGVPTAEFFNGILDDMNMFVMGRVYSGTTPLAGTYGFNLRNDSTYFDLPFNLQAMGLSSMPGDVDQDGDVDSEDADALIAGWEQPAKVVNGVRVGDKFTVRDGDLNFDGITNLADAFILHSALLGAGAGGLDFSRLGGGTVPEPCTLAILAPMLFAAVRKRGRK